MNYKCYILTMEKLDISSFKNAINSLNSILIRYQKDNYDIDIRDAVIQRFEYTYSLAIKMMNRYINLYSSDTISDMTFNEIIRKAIHNHNKYQIEDGLSEQELLYAKIIRDADKIDILYTIKAEPFTTLYGREDISSEVLTDKVYHSIMNGKLPDYKDEETDVDDWINKAGYIFDLYFPYSLQTIRADIFTCLHRVNYQDEQTKERVADIEKMLIDYFEKNTNK